MPNENQLLSNLSQIIKDFEFHSLKPRLAAAEKHLSLPPFIDIAVFGRFKAGKSSFVNHLIGMTILPVGVVPVTAVITRIRYGAIERATVYFSNGKQEIIDFERLPEFIAESNNPENQKQVGSVLVELPALKKFEGLQFVDTPGLGSVFKHNNETSLAWLPQVGVALVAIGVDPPLSKEDISLIEELRRFTPKISVLLTKSDLVTQSELSEIRDFITKQFNSLVGHQFTIWPYSTKPGFETFKEILQEKLLKPLDEKRESEAKVIGRHKLETVRQECVGLLSVALKVSETKDHDRELLKDRVLDEKINLESICDEFQMLGREYSSKTRPFIMERLKKSFPELEKVLIQDLQNSVKSWNGRLWDLSRKFEEWLKESFNREITALSINETGTFLRPLNDFHAAILRSVESFQNRLSANVKDTLGVILKPAEFVLDIKVPSHPDVSFSRLFDSHLDLLSFAIPMSLFRSLIEKHFARSIPWEVEKNLSRLASQWTEGINKSIFLMVQDAQVFTKDQLGLIQTLLDTSPSSTEKLRNSLSQLI